MGAYKLNITRGDSRTLDVTVTNDGDAVDIGGYSVVLEAKEEFESTTLTINKAGSITGDGSTGECSVGLTSTETDIKPGKYYYQIKITSGGNTYTVVSDELHIRETT